MRSAVAEQHGFDEALVDQLGRTEPALDAAQRAAIDFATALISDPAGIGDVLRDRVRAHFTAEQIVELALDTMKWSYQKVPVALGTDDRIDPDRLTPLVFDADGNWVRPT